MWLGGHHPDWGVQLSCDLLRLGQEASVALMKSVEIAEQQYAATQGIGQIIRPTENVCLVRAS